MLTAIVYFVIKCAVWKLKEFNGYLNNELQIANIYIAREGLNYQIVYCFAKMVILNRECEEHNKWTIEIIVFLMNFLN